MGTSLVAQRLKRLPGMWETWVRSLDREDRLEKEMATHSSTLAWRIPWREEPGRLQSMGLQRVGHDWAIRKDQEKCGLPHAKSWLIGKDSDDGRDWGQEEKGTTEDEKAGWYPWLDACESEWTLGVGDGQGTLACCDSWGCKKSDTTERLNWTQLMYINNNAIF